MWDKLKCLKGSLTSLLLMTGDINEVLAPKETKGGFAFTCSIEDFCECVQQMDVVDFPIIGRKLMGDFSSLI